MIPREHTRITVEDEMSGAQAWAQRHGVPLVWDPDILEVRATLIQPESAAAFYLRGRFDDYREIAPAWTFTDAEWAAEPQRQFFPRPAPLPTGGSSMFHTQPVICAPFNRLAYKQHNGPHDNWGGPANWLTAGAASEVRAQQLGDMLSVVYRHFLVTRGRMG